jgi:putative molybdopterin biosynthesis protein
MVKRYLSLVSIESARAILQSSFDLRLREESVKLENSVDRVTAQPILARHSVPGIHVAAMDGIAVRSADTFGAAEQNPITIPVAVRVNTGAIIPHGFDAVIMIEEVWEGDGGYTIRKPVSPWQHVRPVGEDIGESEMILPSNHRIRAHEVGALAAYGITDVIVATLKVGLIPTGSELVTVGMRPLPGQVVESNTIMAATWLNSLGAFCRRYPVTPDIPNKIREAVEYAVKENDIVIISAGSSAGTRDYTERIIAELGEVLVHGVGIKPGNRLLSERFWESIKSSFLGQSSLLKTGNAWE